MPCMPVCQRDWLGCFETHETANELQLNIRDVGSFCLLMACFRTALDILYVLVFRYSISR